MRVLHRFRALILIATFAAAFSLVAVDFAEARRGGGFGSRGARTFNPPAATRTAPNQARPINRSMTPREQGAQSATPGATRAGAAQTRRGGMFGGMMGGLLGGMMLGGLIGMLMGTGLGGMAGVLGLLLQVGLIIVVVMLVMRFLRSRNQPAFAGGTQSGQGRPFTFEGQGPQQGGAAAAASPAGAGTAPPQPLADAPKPPSEANDEIGIANTDLEAFEQLLVEIQAAFAREDYAALRTKCSPEIVSFLSEELSQNAVDGKRNDVTDVALLQGDLSEAWREANNEYATVALRYESIDVMRDRQSGEIIEGDMTPTETTEVWTFVRPVGGTWKLSAIQDG